MSDTFNEEQIDILKQVIILQEEVFDHLRKGLAQTYYVFEVEEGAEYFCSNTYIYKQVPDDLVGYWKMEFAGDLSYEDLCTSIVEREWVKCKQVWKITHEWEEIVDE